jgi:hypothetical protein
VLLDDLVARALRWTLSKLSLSGLIYVVPHLSAVEDERFELRLFNLCPLASAVDALQLPLSPRLLALCLTSPVFGALLLFVRVGELREAALVHLLERVSGLGLT